MFHALANDLRGFRSSTLRVRVIDVRSGSAWIETADLLDCGTRLVVDESQISPINETTEAVRHASALISLES